MQIEDSAISTKCQKTPTKISQSFSATKNKKKLNCKPSFSNQTRFQQDVNFCPLISSSVQKAK